MEAIEKISMFSYESEVPLNIYDGIVLSIIQNIKIATAKLPAEKKAMALKMLESFGLAEYKKIDYTHQIKSIFAELSQLYNKSELLNKAALRLFGKPKSLAPASIQSIAAGDTDSSRWVVSCAIDVLLSETLQPVLKMLSADDIAILWAKPLLNNHQFEYVYKRINDLGLKQVQELIESPNFPINNSTEE